MSDNSDTTNNGAGDNTSDNTSGNSNSTVDEGSTSSLFSNLTNKLKYNLHKAVYDPNANESDVFDEYAINLVKKFDKYDGIILAVAHDEFLNLDLSTIKSSSQTVVFDLKAVLARNGVDARL